MSRNDQDEKPIDLIPILEAIIFASTEALSPTKLVETLNQADVLVSKGEVQAALHKMVEKWAENSENPHGITLKTMADGYFFTTNQRFSSYVHKILQEKPVELSKAQLEVLAIIAYRQPLTRVDVDEIRGVDSSTAVKRLMQLNLVKILGKSEGLGRPLLYGTTKFFLEFFAITSLRDLPTLKSYESLSEAEPENDETVGAITLKDLFEDAKQSSMISESTARLSEEALKSLDEALLNLDGLKKVVAE